MTDAARRLTVVAAAAVITLGAALRLAAYGAPGRVTKRAAAPHADPNVARRAAIPDAGEGAEHPSGGSAGVPASVRTAAVRALASYRSRERTPRWRRGGVRLPALRPLVVAPAGPRRWGAIAITRRGELYLVIDLQRTARGVVVTALR
jgi:hypothetical protein